MKTRTTVTLLFYGLLVGVSAIGCRKPEEINGYITMNERDEKPRAGWTRVYIPAVGVSMHCPITWAWREPEEVLSWAVVGQYNPGLSKQHKMVYNYADLRVFDPVSTKVNKIDTHAEVFVHPAHKPGRRAIEAAIRDFYGKEDGFEIEDDYVESPIGPMMSCSYIVDRKPILGKQSVRFMVTRFVAVGDKKVYDIGFWGASRDMEKLQPIFAEMIESFRAFDTNPSEKARLPAGPQRPAGSPRIQPIIEDQGYTGLKF
jgi:hypothetical protein